MRMIATISLLLVVAAVTVQAADIDQALRNMFERKLSEMDDPKTLDVYHVDGFEAFGLVSLDGELRNLRLGGYHNIVFNNVQMNLNTLEVDIDVRIPSFTLQATYYDLRGRFGALVPIFGNGRCSASTTDVRVRGTARLVDNQFVSLASFKSTMTMGSFTTDFENLLLGGELSDLVNHIIGDMIPFIVRNQQREVTAAVERIVLERVNEALAGMRLEELISRIMEFL